MSDAMDKSQEQAAGGESQDLSTIDQLVEMTTTVDDEKAGYRQAFEHLLKKYETAGAGTALDKKMIDQEILALDESIGAQVREIMSQEPFREVESSWRSLQFLVQRTNFDQDIQIDIFQASKNDILENLRASDSLEQSHFFRITYSENYNQAGGKPYGTIIGNYDFDSGPLDIETLSRISEVAEACHAPFISSVGKEFFKVDSWQEFLEIPNLEPYLKTKAFAEWKGLRQKSSSKYLGLAMPNFLLRQPFGPGGEQAKLFDFSEEATEAEDYLWGNAAFAFASNIVKSFADAGWVVNIHGGKNARGAVEDLACAKYDLAASDQLRIPCELAIDDALSLEISNAGFLDFVPYQNENVACFFGCQSVKEPDEYDTPEATANAKMETMLAYLFPVSRVAHYLKSIQRDNLGGFSTPQSLKEGLKRWLHQYYSESKDTDPVFCAKYPFKDYEVDVAEDPRRPGWFNVDIQVQPRIKLDGIEGKLHLVTQVQKKD